MFKSILPKEAQVSSHRSSSMDTHLRGSAFSPLAVALHLGVLRIKKLIRKCLKPKHMA